MQTKRTVSEGRRASALCSAVIAWYICKARGHVHVVISEPNTYASQFHHRCGLLVVICFAWVLAEMISSVRQMSVVRS